MATQNALPPLPRNQDWTRKKSAGSTRQLQSMASPSVRKLNIPHSASFTRSTAPPTSSPTIDFLTAQQLTRLASSTSQPPEYATTLTSRESDATASSDSLVPRNPQCDTTDNENQMLDLLDDDNDDDVLNSAITNLQMGGGGMTERDSASSVHLELKRMNQQNINLKMEISRLQESLMQRLRGNSKFVGGGQFRSMAQSSAPASPKVAASCSNCFNSRAALKKAKIDLKDTKPIIDALQAKISENLVVRHHLTEANARKQDLIGQLEAELQSAHESAREQTVLVESLRLDLDQARQRPNTTTTDQPDDMHKKYKIQVEISHEKQSQLDRLKDELAAAQHAFRDSQNGALALRNELDQVKASLAMAQTDVQQEMDRANALNVKHHADMIALRHALDLSVDQAAQDLQKRKAGEKALEDRVKALELERDDLTERIHRSEADQKAHSQAVQDMQRESQHLQLLRRKSCGDIVDLTKKYDVLLQQFGALQQEKDSLHQDQLASDAALERVANELKASHAQLETLEQAVLSHKMEKAVLEDKLHQLQGLHATAVQKVADTQGELKEQMEKLSMAQNQVMKQRSQVHALQGELKTTKAEKDGLSDKLADQQQTHTKSLEKAMQSLVRLCVVAPTVNVHLSGQILPCKTVLPKDAIRTIVQRDILPVFSSIFLQEEEGTSPTGSSLDTWLQSLLKEMQTSIEKHLKSVFQV